MPMYTEQYCDDYFMGFINKPPIYAWGLNIVNLKTMDDPYGYMMKMYNTYGSPTGKYNQAYYDKKYNDAMAGSGYVSDCSGFFFYVNGNKDLTAKGYYDACSYKDSIETIDLNHSCCVFKGTPTKINHIGYYCHTNNSIIEMADSDTNFRCRPFNPSGWTYWGKPSFIDYSSPVVVTKPYIAKGVDMSTYQKNVNYQAMKQAGVEFAILKIINKSGDMDSQYAIHSSGCDAVGINVYGVYNYSYATTVEKAQSDARQVLKYLGNRKCAVFIDVEDDCQKRLGSLLIDIINAYQDVIESSGRAFGLYTGLSYFNTYIKPYQSSLRCKNLWIARYYKSYTPMPFAEDPDQSYKPMDGILAWQYTSSGQVSGISGGVDLSITYKDLVMPSGVPTPAPVPTPTPIPPTPSPVPQIRPVIVNTVKTSGANLNVRNKPNTSGDIVGKLKNGSNIIVYGVEKDSGWYRLAVTEEKWCSNTYVESSCTGQISVENSVNIRSADSTAGEIWGYYKNGERIKILHQSTNTGWYLTVGITDPQKRGWVSNKYVKIL